MPHVKVVFGTYWFGTLSTETRHEFLDLLKAHNVKDLDTAYQYVRSGSFQKLRIEAS